MKYPLIAGNWKMYKTVGEAVKYVKEFRSVVKDVHGVEIVLAPTFTAVHAAAEAARNSNIEEDLLSDWLTKCGYSTPQINRALDILRREADNHNRTLYGNNQEVYKLLRYGVPVKTEAGKVTETVHLIDWNKPEKNDFAIAEEVTLKGGHERRPDILLYVNGIAVGVLELKKSAVSIGDGIRHRGGLEGAVGLELPLAADGDLEVFASIEGSTRWFYDPRGPHWYWGGGLALGMSYAL